MTVVYIRVGSKEQLDRVLDIKTISDKIINEIKSNCYMLSHKNELLFSPFCPKITHAPNTNF